jgi:hypothetical protein
MTAVSLRAAIPRKKTGMARSDDKKGGPRTWASSSFIEERRERGFGGGIGHQWPLWIVDD